MQRSLACRHLIESSQPDELIRIVQIVKLPDDLNPNGFLCFDKFTLEELDQLIASARMKRISPELDNGGIGGVTHNRSNSMIQLVSQVFPPSAANACSHWQELGLIFDQMKRL